MPVYSTGLYRVALLNLERVGHLWASTPRPRRRSSRAHTKPATPAPITLQRRSSMQLDVAIWGIMANHAESSTPGRPLCWPSRAHPPLPAIHCIVCALAFLRCTQCCTHSCRSKSQGNLFSSSWTAYPAASEMCKHQPGSNCNRCTSARHAQDALQSTLKSVQHGKHCNISYWIP